MKLNGIEKKCQDPEIVNMPDSGELMVIVSPNPIISHIDLNNHPESPTSSHHLHLHISFPGVCC